MHWYVMSRCPFHHVVSHNPAACSSTCSTCIGSADFCLTCQGGQLASSSSTQVLRAGSCVSANCQGTTSVIPGLGVCLSELIEVPRSSGTTPSPLPSITGLTDPTVINVSKGLAWWEILL